MRVSTFIVSAAAFFIAGCAAFEAAKTPSPEQIEAADFSSAPEPSAVTPAILAWSEDNMKDPTSLQLRKVEAPEKGWVTECVEPGIPPYTGCQKRMFYFGHLVKAEINAKNSYGGYNGFKPYTFLFRGNTIARVVTP